ncbi:MAG: hemerythrin domain-containing protein [Candidatus Dormibacteraeota bacterium]|uniref:Cation-binding protein n=1 Tax=Candidatus Aeolococcus gillhamiae TaxID=3127015 RepID=A0A2W6AES0_9BACT|nr:hemerythrin domain-containing protein [Candidatus Dormibacteraeota bacterium]PZR83768.1 MAG: cation-binding protein [Candidatus Dormibacter sp. RRmetagenome_bin12]
MDITELILHDHHEQRRMFAFLEDIGGSNTEGLGAVWTRLRILLEVHAEAEEQLFYPHLLKIGTGVGGESVVEEVTDVIKDHNDIRDATREAGEHEVGSDDWWKAVTAANKANSDHMAEEEREDLTDFRHHASLQLRHDIAVAFAMFEAEHAAGIEAKDKDPKRYIEQNS